MIIDVANMTLKVITHTIHLDTIHIRVSILSWLINGCCKESPLLILQILRGETMQKSLSQYQKRTRALLFTYGDVTPSSLKNLQLVVCSFSGSMNNSMPLPTLAPLPYGTHIRCTCMGF